MPPDLLAGQVLHREVVIDDVQQVALGALDRHRDEAQFARPIFVLARMQPAVVVDLADLQDWQCRQQRLHAADGWCILRLEFLREARFHDLECWFRHFILPVCASRSGNKPSLAGSTDLLLMMMAATAAWMVWPLLRRRCPAAADVLQVEGADVLQVEGEAAAHGCKHAVARNGHNGHLTASQSRTSLTW